MRRKEIPLFHVVIAPDVLRRSLCLRCGGCSFGRANIARAERARTTPGTSPTTSIVASFLGGL
jgi:hypothetical protein